MDVFLSWSGEESRKVAVALANWLPAVLQRVKPFVSDKDIHSGTRWQAEITGRLSDCRFGVVVVTRENQQSPWLHFEAGALSKSVTDSRLVPLLVDISKADLLLPLNMFQAEDLDASGVESLLQSMNAALEDRLDAATVSTLAAKWWPDLANEVAQAASTRSADPSAPERTDRELLEELVTMVRGLRNALPTPTRPVVRDFLKAYDIATLPQTLDDTFRWAPSHDPDSEDRRRAVARLLEGLTRDPATDSAPDNPETTPASE